MSTKCQLLLSEAPMIDLKYYSNFESRIHYYDLTDAMSQVLLTEEPDFNREHAQIQTDQIWETYFERVFFSRSKQILKFMSAPNMLNFLGTRVESYC